MKVRILVSFKDSVLDPQGQTVKNALHTLGYGPSRTSGRARSSRSTWPASTGPEAEKIIPEISDKVLANPIIEKFTWQIIEDGRP